MIELADIKQELADVKAYIKHYKKLDDKEKLLYWRTIEKYVQDKYNKQLMIEKSMNS